MSNIRSEDPAKYGNESDDDIIERALEILAERMSARSQFRSKPMTSPSATRQFLKLSLSEREEEVFCGIFLDTKHRVIKFEEMFHGTIDSAHVHPRVVVKRALELNAAALIVAHNHPSGVSEPSQADLAITRRLRDALGLVDIRLLDHFIVGEEREVMSFSERGLV